MQKSVWYLPGHPKMSACFIYATNQFDAWDLVILLSTAHIISSKHFQRWPFCNMHTILSSDYCLWRDNLISWEKYFVPCKTRANIPLLCGNLLRWDLFHGYFPCEKRNKMFIEWSCSSIGNVRPVSVIWWA